MSTLLEGTIDLRSTAGNAPDHGRVYSSEALAHLNLSAEQGGLKEGVLTRVLSDKTVQAVLGRFMELGDTFTPAHQLRVAELVAAHGVRQGDELREVELRARAAVLHDAGKCAMQTEIHATGQLSPSERAVVMWHPLIGATLLERLGESGNVVQMVGNHHAHQRPAPYYVFREITPVEEGDGLKPDTLRGTEILSALDFFDACRSQRPYRGEVLSLDETMTAMTDALTVPDYLMVSVADLVTPMKQVA